MLARICGGTPKKGKPLGGCTWGRGEEQGVSGRMSGTAGAAWPCCVCWAGHGVLSMVWVCAVLCMDCIMLSRVPGSGIGQAASRQLRRVCGMLVWEERSSCGTLQCSLWCSTQGASRACGRSCSSHL
jgi:hypothetical protein